MIERLTFVVAVLTMLTLSACSSSDASGPPEIQYGRDICVQCGMIASEAKFAAAYTLEDGTEKLFDDLGGLILTQRATKDAIDPTRTWVHDYETLEWVDVTNAYFVATLSVNTPMGHGIVAFNNEAKAEVFASDVGGEVIRWDVVFALPERDGLVGDHHIDMNTEADNDSTDHDHKG